MKSLKKAVIALIVASILPAGAAFAQEETAPAPEPKKVKVDSMIQFDIGRVVDDTSERSESRTLQDLNDNKKSAFQSAVDLLTVKQQMNKLEYIEETVPIQVRVQGIEASLAWIEKNAVKEKAAKGKSVVWSSSEENLYIPIGTSQRTQATSANQPNSAELSEADIAKLRELGLVIPGKEIAITKSAADEAPKPQASPTQSSNERVFISATGVNAKRVVVMGENKHFSGDVFFDISLSKGKEATTHALNRAKVGEKFSVNGVNFVLADLRVDRVSILNLETSEVKNFNI